MRLAWPPSTFPAWRFTKRPEGRDHAMEPEEVDAFGDRLLSEVVG